MYVYDCVSMCTYVYVDAHKYAHILSILCRMVLKSKSTRVSKIDWKNCKCLDNTKKNIVLYCQVWPEKGYESGH